MIDALKGWLIPQDSPDIVHKVSVESHKDKGNPRVVIRVISLEGAKMWGEEAPDQKQKDEV